MGVIFMRDGKPYVYEAIATVRYTPLERWTARGDDGRYVVKRLKHGAHGRAERPCCGAPRGKYAGKPYDLYFEWSDGRIYCSELVWKIYRDALGLEIGARQKLREFDLTDPAVKAKMRERYGGRVPLERAGDLARRHVRFAAARDRRQSLSPVVRMRAMMKTTPPDSADPRPGPAFGDGRSRRRQTEEA